MASGGTRAERAAVVADVAERLFGASVQPENVIGETLVRATTAGDAATGAPAELAAAVDELARAGAAADTDYRALAANPLAAWIETSFGLATDETGALTRRAPTTVPLAAAELADLTGRPLADCQQAIRSVLMAGNTARHPEHDRPLFAFRLHQFISKGDTVHASLEPEDRRHLTDRYQVAVPATPIICSAPVVLSRGAGRSITRSQRNPTAFG